MSAGWPAPAAPPHRFAADGLDDVGVLSRHAIDAAVLGNRALELAQRARVAHGGLGERKATLAAVLAHRHAVLTGDAAGAAWQAGRLARGALVEPTTARKARGKPR
jgi:hypothetical protein